MSIVYGVIGCVLSFLLIIYRVPVKRFTGNIAWAEQHMGMGGTYTLYLLIGIFGFIFSLMVMTGTVDFLFGNTVTKFFGSSGK